MGVSQSIFKVFKSEVIRFPRLKKAYNNAHKPLQIIKALTATGWGKQKETLMATHKEVMRPALEYASSIWSTLASSTSTSCKSCRTATGCTQDTNIQHLHGKTLPSSNHTYTKSTPNHSHLFNFTHIHTTLSPLGLWTDPTEVMEPLARRRDKLAGGPKAGWSDSPHKQGSMEWVDNNNQSWDA